MRGSCGLPLRSRAAPAGLEHEPLRFDATRLLAERSVDALLWITSFGTEPAPPSADVPRIVLGHPSLAAAVQGSGSVFIPVSTPGIGSPGHLFRTDGSVLMPLRALRDDGLPTVADVLPGYDASSWYGLGAPRNTPAEIVDRLNQEVNAALVDEKMKMRLAELGADTLAGPPADFGKLLAKETEKWGKVVKFSGAKAE